MIRAVFRAASLRHALRHPVQILFGIGGIALGVAVVVGIDIAIDSARRAFDVAATGVGGRATHRIVSSTGGVPNDLFRTLKIDLGVNDAAPVIERTVIAAGPGGEHVFTLLGIDPYSEASFRFGTAGQAEIGGVSSNRDAVILSTVGAGKLGLRSGGTGSAATAANERIVVRAGAETIDFEVAGVIEPSSALDEERLAGLIVTDIATAQERLGDSGDIDRIDLRLETAAEIARVRDALPSSVVLEPASARRAELDRITAAFQLNLRSLSLLALVVGLFLVHNTMAFSVVTRRGLLGRLRALGATRDAIVGVLLGEAFVIGCLGSAIGIGLGVVLGLGLVDVVSKTIGDLYLHIEVRKLDVTALTLVKAAVLGVGASVLAALRPAFEASRADPAAALSRSAIEASRFRRPWIRMSLAALLFVMAVVAIELPTSSLLAGYASMLFVLAGAVALSPLIVRLVTAVASFFLSRWGVVARWSIRSVPAHESRTGLAIAALAVAISMTVGVGVMVDSFRRTVVDWLGTSLSADVYVGVRGVVARRGSTRTLPADFVARIHELDGIDVVTDSRLFESPVQLPRSVDGAPPRLEILIRGGPVERLGFDGPTPEQFEVWRVASGNGRDRIAFCSEPCARRYGLEVGDTLTFTTETGPQDFRIAAIARDFASDLGFVWMPRTVAEHYWPSSRGETSLAIFTDEETSPDALLAKIEALTVGSDATRSSGSFEQARSEGVVMSTVGGLRRATLDIFDRTFAITRVLEILAMVVAALGVFGSLVALVVDRRREIAIWRAHGLTRRELFRALVLQSSAIGLHAAIIAIPLGIVFAVLLVRVVHERSFGWSIDLHIPWTVALRAGAIGIVSAVVGGLVPLSRLARTEVVPALREIET